MPRLNLPAACFLALFVALLATPVPGADPAGSHFELLGKFDGSGSIASVSLPGDGSVVVAGSESGTIYFLDRNGTLRSLFQADGEVKTTSVSEDGSLAVAGTGNGTLYAFDGTGRLLWRNDTRGGNPWGAVVKTAISMDGRTIAACHDQRYLALFSRDGDLLWGRNENPGNGTWTPGNPAYGKYLLYDLSLSGDGSLIGIVSMSGTGYGLARNGETRWAYPMTEYATASFPTTIGVSADGSVTAAGGTNQVIYLVNNRNGDLRWKYETRDPRKGHITGVGISSDGSTVAAGSWVYEGDGRLYLLDGSGRLLWGRSTGCCGVWTVGVSSDGQTIVAGTLSPRLLIFRRDGEVLLDFDSVWEVREVAVSADGSTVAGGSTGGTVLVFGRVPGRASSPYQEEPLWDTVTPTRWTGETLTAPAPVFTYPAVTSRPAPAPAWQLQVPPFALPAAVLYLAGGILALFLVVFHRR